MCGQHWSLSATTYLSETKPGQVQGNPIGLLMCHNSCKSLDVLTFGMLLCRGLEAMKGIESSAEALGAQLGDLRSVLNRLLHTSAK